MSLRKKDLLNETLPQLCTIIKKNESHGSRILVKFIRSLINPKRFPFLSASLF